jgi:hypothetical protein
VSRRVDVAQGCVATSDQNAAVITGRDEVPHGELAIVGIIHNDKPTTCEISLRINKQIQCLLCVPWMKARIDELYSGDETFLNTLSRTCVNEQNMIVPRAFSLLNLHDEEATY